MVKLAKSLSLFKVEIVFKDISSQLRPKSESQ